jgi:cytochrome c oxidase subunit 2
VQEHHRAGTTRHHRWRWAAVAGAVALLSTGCTSAVNDDVKRGWLVPERDVTSITNMQQTLWVGSWVAALAVGVLVWGLTIWCVVRYRRRKTETGLPPQLRYNVPLEILYTVVPLFMIGVLFFYTARDQIDIERQYTDPAVRGEVIGKRWGWDFNYQDAKVYDAGIQADETSSGIDDNTPGTIPTLYLPVGKQVELTLHSRDVIHDFWVPAFSYKKDVIPGRTNYMAITPQREGTYIGRCAELCGEGHSRMRFKVAVVSNAQYQAHLQQLRAAGQTGQLSADLGTSNVNPSQREDTVGQQGGGQTADNGGSNG